MVSLQCKLPPGSNAPCCLDNVDNNLDNKLFAFHTTSCPCSTTLLHAQCSGNVATSVNHCPHVVHTPAHVCPWQQTVRRTPFSPPPIQCHQNMHACVTKCVQRTCRTC